MKEQSIQDQSAKTIPYLRCKMTNIDIVFITKTAEIHTPYLYSPYKGEFPPEASCSPQQFEIIRHFVSRGTSYLSRFQCKQSLYHSQFFPQHQKSVFETWYLSRTISYAVPVTGRNSFGKYKLNHLNFSNFHCSYFVTLLGLLLEYFF